MWYKRTKRKTPKTETEKLIEKLDKVFSKWVRYSNAPKGYCRCVTCPKIDTPDQMDAGHYIGRQYKATRWDARNVWPQCKSCNRFNEGRKGEYALFLTQKYGPDILPQLEQTKWMPFKVDELWLRTLINEYETKLKEL